MVTPLGSMLGYGSLGGAISSTDPLYSVLPFMAMTLGVGCIISYFITRFLRKS